MPDFNSHISQAEKNLSFLEGINSHLSAYMDWQVTVSFYTAVHLVNSHLSNFKVQYRTHSDVDSMINPYMSKFGDIKLPEDQYIAYNALQSLSRRSRYLVHLKDRKISSDKPAFTYDQHLDRALRHLETLLVYFCEKYTLDIPAIKVIGTGLKSSDGHKYILPTV